MQIYAILTLLHNKNKAICHSVSMHVSANFSLQSGVQEPLGFLDETRWKCNESEISG